MMKHLHIAFGMLLGMALLAGCHRAESPAVETDPFQAIGEPVKVSLTLSVHGFGEDGVLSKADYEDLDVARRYVYEDNIVDCKLFVFKPTTDSPFVVEGGNKVPNLEQFVRITPDEEEVLYYQNIQDNRWRLEFKINDTYKSLVVLALANVGTAADAAPAAGSTLKSVIEWLQENAQDVLVTGQSQYVEGKAGILMHGMKAFGSEADLKYWRNMSTPLTVKGFKDATELANYTGATGATRPEDRLKLRHGLVRLRLSYDPASGQLPYRPEEVNPAADPQTFVEITSVKLHNYDTKARLLPKHFFPVDAQLNPFSQADSLAVIKTLQTTEADVEFVRPKGDPAESGDYSWVAYVAEQKIIGDPDANPYKDPYLVVTVKVTDRDENHNETVTTFEFEREKITRRWTAKWKDEYGNDQTEPAERIYKNSPWTEWLQMRNIHTTRKDIDNADVDLGKYYHLVRNYAYEWIAEGWEGLLK